MKLLEKDYELLYSKLENRFKKSGDELVERVKDKKELSKSDMETILKKLEYNFKKSGNEILDRLKAAVA